MRRDVQIRAPLKLHRIDFPFELDGGPAFQDDHPFILLLVVPESFGRGLPLGDDPLDAKSSAP